MRKKGRGGEGGGDFISHSARTALVSGLVLQEKFKLSFSTKCSEMNDERRGEEQTAPSN